MYETLFVTAKVTRTCTQRRREYPSLLLHYKRIQNLSTSVKLKPQNKKQKGISLERSVQTNEDHYNRQEIKMVATSLDKTVHEELPPVLEASSEQPPLFDGTIRLYTSYTCPFAQRVWITRNFKGLQDKIKLVPLNLASRPAWYADKVYPPNKVPSLEHNGKIIGESLDLIKYVDSNFEGPSLLPDDPAKKEFAEELFAYSDKFNGTVFGSFKEDDPPKIAGPAFDPLETALHKFGDGPFFLGEFSLVDITYIPFVERFQIYLSEAFKYDITAGRPKLAAWIEEVDKIQAYKQTKKTVPKELVEFYNQRFRSQK